MELFYSIIYEFYSVSKGTTSVNWENYDLRFGCLDAFWVLVASFIVAKEKLTRGSCVGILSRQDSSYSQIE